jgi:hypothetical protein
MSDIVRNSFLQAAADWLCDGYFLDLRYLSLKHDGQEALFGVLVGLNPLPPAQNVQFRLNLGGLRAGQIQCRAPEDSLALLDALSKGELSFESIDARFPSASRLSFYSESADHSPANAGLHLRISSDHPFTLGSEGLRVLNDGLRCAEPPFDGLTDLTSWLGVENPARLGQQAAIEIRINSPVDLADEVSLVDDGLAISLRALGAFNPDKLKLAVRIAPGTGLARFQLANEIHWSTPVEGVKRGTVALNAANGDVAQLMLSVGDRTVRRHVVVDRSRARTVRLAAALALDPGLEQLRASLRSSGKDRDSARFEKAVAMLLFLHGFTPTPHVDTDAPDLLVATPGGRLVLVECTLKVSDFNGKVSKLAVRRNRLISGLASKGHTADVHAVLVCASPKEEIVGVDEIELARQNVTLLAGEALARALDDVQTPRDPDELLVRASAALVETQQKASTLG